MSYGVSISAADVNWQIEALKVFPEIANKHFYPAMHRAARDLKAEIQPNVPVATGRAVSALKSQVSGKGLNIQARVGWFGKDMPWYVNIIEYGAKAHEQGYIPALGVKIRIHPGFPAFKFMETAFQRSAGNINSELDAASLNVVADLAVK